MCPLLFRHSKGIRAESILFRGRHTTNIQLADTHFTRKALRESSGADEGDFIVVHKDEVVASGGLMLNYNFPYADIYMGVEERFRGQGFGSYIVQELKKYAYAIGRVPAARCNINNVVSHFTLLKAGFEVCGYRLTGDLQPGFLQA
ncbi:MAG: GNAT family N-acetyltransferase [Chitinophagaceae bacterium]|nr:MAG: GNAT family N-acetyltransferase [Chitinophagaceae bacterium]